MKKTSTWGYTSEWIVLSNNNLWHLMKVFCALIEINETDVG